MSFWHRYLCHCSSRLVSSQGSCWMHVLIPAVVSFCGVVVPYAGLPTFWQSWMYWLTPFKYLLEGFLALLVRGQEIRCETTELAIFPPPSGQDCQTYAGQFAQQSGGYVQTQPDGNCGFCQYATGEAFAASFNVFPQYIWRNFGTSNPQPRVCICLR